MLRPTDAALLLDLVRTHRAQLRPWRLNWGSANPDYNLAMPRH